MCAFHQFVLTASRNFIDFDGKFQTLIFSEYYKKKAINIQIFTFYSLIIE